MRVLGTLVAASSVLLLAGCGATGNDAPTRNIRQVTDGRDFEANAIKIRDLRIVVGASGTPTLVGTFINAGNSNDAIASIAVNGTAIKVASAPIALAPNKPVIFSGDSANASAVITGVTLVPGSHATVTISFAGGLTSTSKVLVTDN